MNETKLVTVPATISRFGEGVPNEYRDQDVEVWTDPVVPQVYLQIDGLAFCFGLAEAEVLETAIRVARQGMRRR